MSRKRYIADGKIMATVENFGTYTVLSNQFDDAAQEKAEFGNADYEAHIAGLPIVRAPRLGGACAYVGTVARETDKYVLCGLSEFPGACGTRGQRNEKNQQVENPPIAVQQARRLPKAKIACCSYSLLLAACGFLLEV